MQVLHRLAVPFVVLVLFAACERTTDPQPEQYVDEPVDLELAVLDGRSVEEGGQASRAAGPHLRQLLHRALRRIHEERGAEEVRRVTAALRRLIAEAKEARRAGDRDLAMRKMQEANLAAARIVVFAFGPSVVPRTLAAARDSLATLRARIEAGEAAGEDVTRLRSAYRRASELSVVARGAMDAGHPLRALILATRVIDLVVRA